MVEMQYFKYTIQHFRSIFQSKRQNVKKRKLFSVFLVLFYFIYFFVILEVWFCVFLSVHFPGYITWEINVL